MTGQKAALMPVEINVHSLILFNLNVIALRANKFELNDAERF